VKIQDPPPGTAPTTFPTGVEFDRESLKKIETELARHIARSAPGDQGRAKKAYTVSGLAEIVSADIADEKLRAAFVRIFSGDKSTPTGDPNRPARRGNSPRRRVRRTSMRRRSPTPKRPSPSTSARSQGRREARRGEGA